MLNLKIILEDGKSSKHQFHTLTTFSVLVEALQKKCKIVPESLEILVGYPPVLLSDIHNDSLLSDFGIVSGSTVYLRPGLIPSIVKKKGKLSTCAGDRLRAAGFDDETIELALDIAPDDFDLAQEICNNMKSTNGVGSTTQQSNDCKNIMRRVIDANNSCLFNAIGYLLDYAIDTSESYRSICASIVMSDSTTYSEEILGKSPSDYAYWISDTEKWGGEIEMNILANYFSIEIAAVDVQTGLVYKYGTGNVKRIFLLYDGIHYDALVKSSSEGPPPMADDIRIFDSADESIVDDARALAAELRGKKKFVDLGGCDIRCLVCQIGLCGQMAAVDHAKSTGHQNFGQI